MLKQIHHVAIICSDYEVSKDFYTRILKLNIVQEVFRTERNSWKLDLALNGTYCIELFSFPDPPPRPSRPESVGLRHLAFRTENLDAWLLYLNSEGIKYEEVRTDEHTGCRFTFISDPDQLPIEFYES